MSSRPAKQEDRSSPSDDKHAAEGEEESDWDEYADEIASAVAFASWQEASANMRDEDDVEVAAELQEGHGSDESWEDWVAVDEIEYDATCHLSKDKDEEL